MTGLGRNVRRCNQRALCRRDYTTDAAPDLRPTPADAGTGTATASEALARFRCVGNAEQKHEMWKHLQWSAFLCAARSLGYATFQKNIPLVCLCLFTI